MKFLSKKVFVTLLIIITILILGIIFFGSQNSQSAPDTQSSQGTKPSNNLTEKTPQQIATMEATNQALKNLVGLGGKTPKSEFSDHDMKIINQWSKDRKMEGTYSIGIRGNIEYKEDELITKYRTMSVDDLRSLMKTNKSYQLQSVLVEKLLQENMLKFDKNNPDLVTEVTDIVLDLTKQGNVMALQNLVDTYLANGHKVSEINGKKVWLTDPEAYKSALKYAYVLERRNNVGLKRHLDIVINQHPILTKFPNYLSMKEAAREEGEQLYQQLEAARKAEGLGYFDNQVPKEMDKLYNHIYAPLLEAERKI